jgi:ADP-ribose pyrophosphatase YjhB (NUDIX family)
MSRRRRASAGTAGTGTDRAGTDRTRVAAYAVAHDDDGRILLCHISPSVGVGDVWTLPGGGLDFGEAPEAAVLRELAEETGYTGELEGLVGVSDRMFHDVDGADRMHAIRILYRVRIVGGDLRDEPDGSTDTCRWFTPRQARNVRLGELARHALDLPRSGQTSRPDTMSPADSVSLAERSAHPEPARPEPARPEPAN